MDILKQIKKDVKSYEITFRNLNEEYQFIKGYLVAKNEDLPPFMFIQCIRGESILKIKYK